jgi:hypothetical protein
MLEIVARVAGDPVQASRPPKHQGTLPVMGAARPKRGQVV